MLNQFAVKANTDNDYLLSKKQLNLIKCMQTLILIDLKIYSKHVIF